MSECEIRPPPERKSPSAAATANGAQDDLEELRNYDVTQAPAAPQAPRRFKSFAELQAHLHLRGRR
jgi:hypothetical protein